MLESGENGISWRVVTEDPDGLDLEELDWPCSKRVVIAPMPSGRGGGVGKILAGVALVAFAIIAGPVAGGFLGLGMGGFLSAGAAQAIGAIGLSLAFGGVAQLLTPTPSMPGVSSTGGTITDNSSTDQQKSALFDKSNANTAQGSVVPVLYGERLVGSLAVLSFGIELQNSL